MHPHGAGHYCRVAPLHLPKHDPGQEKHRPPQRILISVKNWEGVFFCGVPNKEQADG